MPCTLLADPCEYFNVAQDHINILSKMQNYLADYWAISKTAAEDIVLGTFTLNASINVSIVPFRAI